ncbi:hypothetical protein CGMCC3_g10478 [Colletotrichum fructicola]|nr:uncharacterized protein CGMCC3_g10478 [Colletotrichum fructicola]KAE9573646.1 hypothetical protein CGMCC3_g10478 [Colletotrichum fructicola]
MPNPTTPYHHNNPQSRTHFTTLTIILHNITISLCISSTATVCDRILSPRLARPATKTHKTQNTTIAELHMQSV